MPNSVEELLQTLRQCHDRLVPIAADPDAGALARGSYCPDWTVAQVFSHLGSGAEIGRLSLRAALGRGPEPDREAIWARWNAMPAEEMARAFVDSDDRYLTAVEQLDAADRETVRVPFFLGPMELAAILTFRLNEFTLHSWDILVGLDPAATLPPAAVPPLLDLLTVLGPMVAAAPVAERLTPTRLAVHVTEPDRRFLLAVDGAVRLMDAGATQPDAAVPAAAGHPAAEPTAAEDPAAGERTGRLALPAEAFVRLVAGRLDGDHTPPGVSGQGRPELTDLRALFPGF